MSNNNRQNIPWSKERVTEIYVGDCNGDGTVNVLDLGILRQYLADGM